MIVGCGFRGLCAAKPLRHAGVDVTVVDRTNHHPFQPLLYQFATGILFEGDIAPPIRDVLRHQRNTHVVLGEVIGSGVPAWLLWLVVQLMTLTGFKNLVSVFFNWMVAFLWRGRTQRVITAAQQVFARHAVEAHERESGTAVPTISVTARRKRNALSVVVS